MSEGTKVKIVNKGGPFGAGYLVTYIGAAVYFVSQVHDFWPIILALLKAFVWPAFFVYGVLHALHV